MGYLLTRTEAKTFGRDVRLLLEELDVTQETLAVACAEEDMSIAYVKAVCTGAIVYESAKLRAVAGALGLNLPSEKKRAGKKR